MIDKAAQLAVYIADGGFECCGPDDAVWYNLYDETFFVVDVDHGDWPLDTPELYEYVGSVAQVLENQQPSDPHEPYGLYG